MSFSLFMGDLFGNKTEKEPLILWFSQLDRNDVIQIRLVKFLTVFAVRPDDRNSGV